MAGNPTQLAVLFQGAIYQADALPRRYLPALLSMTLTEPSLLLAAVGLVATIWKQVRKASSRPSGAEPSMHPPVGLSRIDSLLLAAWFAVPFLYVVILRPPLYDGYRHFLFMLPPVFVAAGHAIELLYRALRRRWVSVLLLLALVTPGVLAIVGLHPYEYAYYNLLAGGMGGAFRRFETEYWLTCYKESVEQLVRQAPAGTRLFVRREPQIASYYAGNAISVRDWRLEAPDLRAGDYVLVSTRSNEDLRTMRDGPVAFAVGRRGADFCIVKSVGN
jgi:hypothetical protein